MLEVHAPHTAVHGWRELQGNRNNLATDERGWVLTFTWEKMDHLRPAPADVDPNGMAAAHQLIENRIKATMADFNR